MKNIIKYNYSLDVDEINDIGNGNYCFKHEERDFFFIYFNRLVEDLNDIWLVNMELRKKNLKSHEIILNKEQQPLTKYSDLNYMLLSVDGDLNDTFDLVDILDLSNTLVVTSAKGKLYRNNWFTLWSSKIDYFEYQVRELGKSKRVVIDSFSYYLGLAENAIAYVNKTTTTLKPTSEDRVTLAHRKIYYPNYRLNYYNPLNYIFDLELRDVAEYVKALFFSGLDVWHEINRYFENKKFSSYGYQMFYARLLYPSYYFDLFEKIMEKDLKEDSLLEVIDKNAEYELFLSDMYHYLLNFSLIEKIDWLVKSEAL